MSIFTVPVQSELKNILKDPQQIDVHRRIAFAAAYNWQHSVCQELSTSVIVSLTRSNEPAVHEALAIVFRGNERLLLNSNMRSIIEAVLPNDRFLMASAINLIEGLEFATTSEPQLVFNICNRFLEVGIEEIKTAATEVVSEIWTSP
ncbi:MAG: hypothetical protein RBQ88_12090 [Desulfobulbus oligotrophicus]|nr:hypothetical protein [Desulfobulbus oligotrophicus]